jgi:hypothetical protein
MKSPAGVAGQGLGLPSSGRLRNKTLMLRRYPGYASFWPLLGGGREANVWRTDHAALLHRRLQII